MDFKKDAKENTCPACGSPEMKPARITDQNNITHTGKLCIACNWHG